jgi:hypothetical protein
MIALKLKPVEPIVHEGIYFTVLNVIEVLGVLGFETSHPFSVDNGAMSIRGFEKTICQGDFVSKDLIIDKDDLPMYEEVVAAKPKTNRGISSLVFVVRKARSEEYVLKSTPVGIEYSDLQNAKTYIKKCCAEIFIGKNPNLEFELVECRKMHDGTLEKW